MLFSYLQQTQRFLDDQGQPIHNPADLTVWINEARVQIALGSECLRTPALLTMVVGQQPYNFASLVPIASPTAIPGVAGIGNVRMARWLLPSGGYRRIQMRSWEWFETYYLNIAAPVPGSPVACARLQPGVSGTIWFSPEPDIAYEVTLDSVAYPSPLATDTDPEALPSPWQDAVPFFACHLAMVSVGDQQSAAAFWSEYEVFERRAVQMTTPSRLPRRYPGGTGAQQAAGHVPLTMMPQPATGRR